MRWVSVTMTDIDAILAKHDDAILAQDLPGQGEDAGALALSGVIGTIGRAIASAPNASCTPNTWASAIGKPLEASRLL